MCDTLYMQEIWFSITSIGPHVSFTSPQNLLTLLNSSSSVLTLANVAISAAVALENLTLNCVANQRVTLRPFQIARRRVVERQYH